jgi:hypothetical protein
MAIAAPNAKRCKLKAFCLAIAFLLASLPAYAEELPQTGNAWRASEPDMAEPGNYKWTVIDNNGEEAQAPDAMSSIEARDKSIPARMALEKVREETARILADAKRTSTKVERIRYDLRLRCVVEKVDTDSEPLANTKLPWIWGSSNEAEADTNGMFEMCEIDYSQKVRAHAEPKAEAPQYVDYTVLVPVNE